jgi:hypothetical protein
MNLICLDGKFIADALNLYSKKSASGQGKTLGCTTYDEVLTKALKLATDPIVLRVGLFAQIAPFCLELF